MVGYPADVEEVYFSGEWDPGKCRERCRPRRHDHIRQPSRAGRISEAAQERGLYSLDAPVSGGDVGARQATLAIMVGGDPGVFEKTLPLLETPGKTISLMGGPGAGQHTKMANQIAIASGMIGVVESLPTA